MGVNKLDIEFEDDEEIQAREEAERKKREVVSDVDLEFGVEGEDSSSQGTPKAKAPSEEVKKEAPKESPKEEPKKEAPAKSEETSAPKPKPKPVEPQESTPSHAEVKDINEARTQAPQAAPQASSQPVSVGADYKLGDELKKVSTTNQVLAIEIEARVKVEVAQQMTKTIADFHAQNKMLEYKINKLLTQMHKKAPALKAELMQIKKYLKEHASLDEDSEEESSNESGQQASKKPVKKKAA